MRKARKSQLVGKIRNSQKKQIQIKIRDWNHWTGMIMTMLKYPVEKLGIIHKRKGNSRKEKLYRNKKYYTINEDFTWLGLTLYCTNKEKKREWTKHKSSEISQTEKQRKKTCKPLETIFTMSLATLFCKLRSATSFEDGYIF